MVEKTIDISVIMLTYNREQYVARAIESILAQTYGNFEFIIIDNGSKDNSGNIAREYAAKDSRIKFESIPKSTIGVGRNRGLDLACGEFVTFIDDDDWTEPDMLEFLIGLARKHDADIALCGSNKSEGDVIKPNCVFAEELVMTPEEAVVTLLKRKKYNAGMPTKLFKRHLLENERFKEKGKYDDISVVYKYFAKARKVVGKGEPKYYCYRHPGNNSAFTTNDMLLAPEQLEEYFAAFRERTLYLQDVLPAVGDYGQYSEWSYLISMCNKIISNNLTNCSKQLDYARNELIEHYQEFYESQYIEDFEKEYMERYIKTHIQEKI